MTDYRVRPGMRAISIRNFREELHRRLRVLAAKENRSIEEVLNIVVEIGVTVREGELELEGRGIKEVGNGIQLR